MQNVQLEADIMQMSVYSTADMFAPHNLLPDPESFAVIETLADYEYPVDNEMLDDMLDYSSSSVSEYDGSQVPATPPASPVGYADAQIVQPAFLFLKDSDFSIEEDDEEMQDAHGCSASEIEFINMTDLGIAQVLESMDEKKTAQDIRELADNGR